MSRMSAKVIFVGRVRAGMREMIPPIAIEVKPLRLGATLRFWGQVWGQTRVIRRTFAYFSVPAYPRRPPCETLKSRTKRGAVP
jgi:hypothetical protein